MLSKPTFQAPALPVMRPPPTIGMGCALVSELLRPIRRL